MDFKDLSPDLREKAKACTSPEELLALAKREGYKLSEAELEAVSGGAWLPSEFREYGDTRNGIDRSKVRADFAEGKIDARDLDW